MGGAVGALLACFFPWKTTAVDGEVLGVFSLGFPVLLLVGAAIAALAVRARAKSSLSDGTLLALQAGALVLAELWSLVFVVASWDGQQVRSPIGNYQVAVSTPSIGVFAAIVAVLVAGAGTLLRMKERF